MTAARSWAKLATPASIGLTRHLGWRAAISSINEANSGTEDLEINAPCVGLCNGSGLTTSGVGDNATSIAGVTAAIAIRGGANLAIGLDRSASGAGAVLSLTGWRRAIGGE